MGVTFKPVFNRTGKKNKKGLYSVHLRVTVDGRTAYLNPKLPKITQEQWLGKPNKWIKDNHPNHFLFNKKIQEKMSELFDFADRQQLLDKAITLNKVEEFFTRRGDKTLFNDYVEEYIRTYKFGAPATKKKYETFKKLLDEFNSNIRFSNLEENLFLNFRDFLFKEKKQRGNTVDKYFDPFKKIVRDAVKKDYLQKNPFDGVELKIKKEKPVRVTLTCKELEAIENLRFTTEPKSLEPHRDMFLLLCYSGLYYNDLRELTGDSLVIEQGKEFLIGDRYKTGERYISPIFLFPRAKAILEKYSFPEKELPLISDQKFNESLKLIRDKAEIGKNLFNKVGRNVFTDQTATMGFSELMQKKFLGHTKDSRSLKHYVEIEVEHILQFLT
ncbi:MAG: phage integrase SAM-like domain-containing protein [Cytophagia bacterium]|nr:phage integrase SAM-like domain-containing protein [Cytophagia bacterium]